MVAGFLLSLLIGFGAAIGFLPALRLDARKRAGVLLACAVPILLSPFTVPGEASFVRFLAAVCSFLILSKIYDLHRDAERASRIGWRTLLAFLLNWSSIVLRKLDAEPRLPKRENIARLASGLAGLGAGVAINLWLFRLDWSAQPFAIEHAAKVMGLFCALMPAGTTVGAIGRLAGGRTREWFASPFLSRTPADFWRRYNRPVGQFFFEDTFKRVGGLHSPVRATLVTFALSGVAHEYVFGIASGQVHGYQLAYFLVQGCAVAATMRIRPGRLQVIPWIAGTVAFNLASSMIFFANLNLFVPFYSRALPGWLRW